MVLSEAGIAGPPKGLIVGEVNKERGVDFPWGNTFANIPWGASAGVAVPRPNTGLMGY